MEFGVYTRKRNTVGYFLKCIKACFVFGVVVLFSLFSLFFFLLFLVGFLWVVFFVVFFFSFFFFWGVGGWGVGGLFFKIIIHLICTIAEHCLIADDI